MTALTIQSLRVEDCETAVLRTYYVWGSIHDPVTADPPRDEATDEERLIVARRGYALYDGCPPQPGDQLGPLEAFGSIGIGSRVVIHDVRRMLALAESAHLLLTRLADDAQIATASAWFVASLYQTRLTAPYLPSGQRDRHMTPGWPTTR